MINILIDIAVASAESQVGVLAYANNFLTAGTFGDLRKWWDTLTIIGTKFGYYPEQTKTQLVIKPYALQKTNKIFSETKIKITNEGDRYLGRTVGTEKLKDIYMKEKVMEWKF